MTTTSQTFKIAVSPEERFQLVQLAFDKSNVIAPADGKKFRRFQRAFGLRGIVLCIRAREGVPPETVRDSKLAVFTVTSENVEYLRDNLGKLSRTANQEDILGRLFDLADDLLAGRESEPIPEGTPEYDPAVDGPRWELSQEDAKVLKLVSEGNK